MPALFASSLLGSGGSNSPARFGSRERPAGYDPHRLPCDDDVEWTLYIMALNWRSAESIEGPDGRRQRNAMGEDMGLSLIHI